MTATDVLRRMLDERGVEYMKVDFLDGEHITSFDVNGREYGYHEFPDGGTLLRVWHPSPEQAIAATLGTTDARPTQAESSGTCHVESSIIDTYEYNRWEYELSCGHTIIWEDSEPPRYCPECGRRIEQ